jgi:hypothetical protein
VERNHEAGQNPPRVVAPSEEEEEEEELTFSTFSLQRELADTHLCSYETEFFNNAF